MSRKPQSYLPPNSQPWARYVEESLANLERGTSINGQNSNNNLRQLNSSVQLLSQQQQALEFQQGELEDQQAALAAQQAYLATFQTYVSTNPASSFTTTVNSVVTLRNLSLSFNLPRASSVLITISAAAFAYADEGGATPQPTARFNNALTVNGVGIPTFTGSNGGFIGLFGNFSGTGRFGTEGALFASSPVQLNAGVNNISVNWTTYLGGGSGYSVISNASIVASVIG
jgi:hypothetical protein